MQAEFSIHCLGAFFTGSDQDVLFVLWGRAFPSIVYVLEICIRCSLLRLLLFPREAYSTPRIWHNLGFPLFQNTPVTVTLRERCFSLFTCHVSGGLGFLLPGAQGAGLAGTFGDHV